MNVLRRILQILVPLLLLALGAFGAWQILANRAQPVVRQPVKLSPLVRVAVAERKAERLDVLARGTVEPLRTVELAAEVGGRIVATHAALRAGGTFTPNDVLVEIDPTDYRLAVVQQEAAVARAELRLVQERAEAEAALRAWRGLEGDRDPDPLVRREPQIRDAEAALAAAKAQLEQSRTELARTRVQLPFSGFVRSVHADLGQTVQRGQRLAVVLETGAVEVRLPLSLDDAAFVDLPLAGPTDEGPEVELTADFAGARRTWHGRIVRTEGEVDRRTRQLTVVARVAAPEGDAPTVPPLLVGMFVDARISGRTFDGVVALPRGALVAGDHVWVVEPRSVPERLIEAGQGSETPADGVLRRRPVDILRAERDRVLLRGGVAAGEKVCLSSLDAPVDGMTVRLREVSTDEAEETR